MTKTKKRKPGKRMKKKELIAALMDFFHSKPDEVLSLKYIFESTSPHHASPKDVVQGHPE